MDIRHKYRLDIRKEYISKIDFYYNTKTCLL